MAELALAIIPLGVTVTSGLVKYLKTFNDHDDDRARLVRQAERFETTFQSLRAALDRPQLNPELSISASEASACLRECQKALEELDNLQQKTFATITSTVATTPHARTKGKIKDGYKKLLYPLRKSDIEALEGALEKLSTTLSLALGILHLDEESLTRKILNEQMVEIQKNTIVNSNTSTAIKELHQPISRIDLAAPVLQTSVDAIVPHFDQRFDQISYQISYQHVQMQAQIKSLLDMAGLARYQDHLGTNQQPSYNHSGEQGNYIAARETEQELRTLYKRADSVSTCSCHLQRVRQSKRFALGPVHFAEEMLPNLSHEKDCVFFIPSSGYEKTRTVRFTGLASLLKKGVEVSFSIRARAGRFSISPSFTYFPVVDKNVAPAFLVMGLLLDAIKLKNINETRSRVILNATQRKLHELFCSGRASPNDVTQDSSTLLHLLGFTAYHWLTTLQGANSPFVHLSQFATDMESLHTVIDGTFVPASIYGQLNAENDVEERSTLYFSPQFDRRALLDYYDHNQSVASIQYGPLSLAVIRNNLQEVERLLSLHAHMLKEVSFYGETPLHIAIYRLDILKTLVKKANPEILIQRSNYGATVLSLAIQVSHEICDRGNALDESCCPCTLPLRIILAAGCPIIPHRDFLQDGHRDIPGWSFSEASLHCKTLLANELRSRRRQLRDLVRNKLSITEFSKFTPLEEVPDIDAIAMDRLLRQKGILGLGPLSTFVDEDLPQHPCRDVVYYSKSIFFDLRKPEDADIFVDSGFKMVCADQDHDSSLDRALFNRPDPLIGSISLNYAIWLFDHQAPLWKWSYRFTSPMPSIFVLADILSMQDYECPCQDNTKDRVEIYLSESVLVDDCSCLCSPDGCTPFTSRMRWLAHPYEQAQDLNPRDYATRFGSYVEIYGKRLNLSHHVIMVRQATFAALDLKHTCLERPGYRWPSRFHWMYLTDPVSELDPDEKEFEILNVDAEAINQLEDMVVMFQDFVLTGRQTTISSNSDSFDIDYSAFNEPSTLGIDKLYYQRALEFWKHIWANRMQIALDTVAKGWDNNLAGLNDLVHISTCEEVVQETRDSLDEGDDEILNRIIQRIQDI
ncbi:hypothetical protein BFJ66_g8878 [Fusarium oxysporum f. sp. cepae]|uniref:Uncharacterized protein n=1 Tax=Fusarium oxysporum f. sp. cepae TaxID=396571 RepID=A0A3L6N2I6_FUSOX|nr:hypothetical protein BFJ65_g13526 [Fusarium oxysporum f. sp. cepae]RKK45769.1 hypothetical protein BFJ66_g8878 [Fusarium oxysporum f. sp. cepae]